MAFRRWYYDLFSGMYDPFVQMHSHDPGQTMRTFFTQAAWLESASVIVDLCTGTGSSALSAAEANGAARIIGIDFSRGMLSRAHKKTPRGSNLLWIQADVSRLPIASGTVDRITCSYAMYELPGRTRNLALKEVLRVLKPGGMFAMMEHLPPDRPFIKLLYLIRIHVLGTSGVRSFAGAEEGELAAFLTETGTTIAPGGKTMVVYGFKPGGPDA